MSFGWSAGDVAAAINLISRIVTSVGNVGGARENFQELEMELLSLSRALHEIAVLTRDPGQIPEIVTLKFVACLCEDTLKRFYEKLKLFDSTLSTGAEKGRSKGKSVLKMVRWELLVKKDIPELRSYLVAHVGSLNLRLNTALLKAHSRSRENATQNATALQETLHTEALSICEKINLISQGDTIPRLDSLLNVATNVWNSQSEMMERLSTVLNRLPNPDLGHTWAQAPVRFEDALGRVLPIPSEYDWDKVEAVIHAQFKRGPGYQKVRSGEYELYDGTFTDLEVIKEQNFCPIPGMSIKMAFIVGQYAGSEHCPRPGCRSMSFKRQGSSLQSTVCTICQSWFRITKYTLPKPLKPPEGGNHSSDVNLKQQLIEYSKLAISQRERAAYKNLSLYITELPPTPKVFRDKYYRNGYMGFMSEKDMREDDSNSLVSHNASEPLGYYNQVLVLDRPNIVELMRTRAARQVQEIAPSQKFDIQSEFKALGFGWGILESNVEYIADGIQHSDQMTMMESAVFRFKALDPDTKLSVMSALRQRLTQKEIDSFIALL